MDFEVSRITKLKNAENWAQWKFQVSVLLRERDALKIVNGDFAKPTPVEEATAAERKQLAEWLKADSIAQKIIATSVADSQLVYIMNCSCSQDMWNALHNLYEQKSETSIHMLQQMWYKVSKDPKDSMASYIAKLKDLAHRLQTLGEPIADSMIITKILMTLTPTYNHFVTAWESTPQNQRTLPNLIERLLAEETRCSAQEKGLNEAFAAMKMSKKTSQKWKRGSNSSKETDIKNKGDKSDSDICHKCKKPGHWARGCRAKVEQNQSNDIKPKGQALVSQASLCLDQSECSSDTWYLDSGATDHMSNRKKWFINLKFFDKPHPVNVGKKGESTEALGVGDINILAYDGDQWVEKHLSQVLFVPNLRYNLFSAGSALDKGLLQISTAEGCRFEKDEITVAVGVRRHKLYEMQFKVLQQEEGETEANLAIRNSLQSWHEKLGHQNIHYVKQYLITQGIQVDEQENFFCEGCVFGKSHKLPFPKRKEEDYKPQTLGELIHSDLCGPFQENSINGSRYFLLFKDGFSRYRVVYFLKYKSETAERIKDFIAMTSNHAGRTIKTLRTDNGLEFINMEVKEILKQHGIQHQRTVVFTPEQNGSAERENRTIVEAMRSMLHSKNLPLKLWAEGVNTAVYIFNRTGTSLQRLKTPCELWYGHKAKLEKLVTFGTTTYAHIPKEKRRKLDSKAEKGYFVGYDENVKGFRIWFPETDRVDIRRDVIFREDDHYTEVPAQANQDDQLHIFELQEGSETKPQNHQPQEPQPQIQEELEESTDGEEVEVEESTVRPQERRALRDRSKIKRPERYEEGIDPDVVLLTEVEEPLNYHEAVTGSHAIEWKRAMDEEIKSLKKNNTWKIVDQQDGRKPIENRWVFKLKRKADGSIDRFKARLVAKGYSQVHGVDYHETFSPVMKFVSIRIILALAASRNMVLQQFDIKTAFLNGKLPETIYMKQPEGYNDGTNHVCLLERSLYGLKQSSRCWHEHFTDFLKEFNLEPTKSDPCVFTNGQEEDTLILGIYIDDGVMAASNQATADMLLSHLKKKFEISTGNLSLFLGFQIDRTIDGSIFLHQSGYTKRVLERFNVADANPATVPMDKHQELCILAHNKQESERIRAPYREAVGSLMYLAIGTRPDIAFALSTVSQYLESPDKIHWNAIKRILKYLKGTIAYGLYFKANANLELLAFSDADYAGDIETRRSTSGYIFKLGDCTISWCSQKQRVVALSTTESEFIAAAQTIKELIWLNRLICEITRKEIVKPKLLLDNQGAIKLLKNPEFHKRTKHIDVKYHYAREKFQEGLFDLEYVSTKEQQADILTKPLLREQFCYIRELLNVKPKI